MIMILQPGVRSDCAGCSVRGFPLSPSRHGGINSGGTNFVNRVVVGRLSEWGFKIRGWTGYYCERLSL